MTKRTFARAAVALGIALSGCGALGSDTTFPDVLLTNGITSFRPVTAQETAIASKNSNQVLVLGDATVDRGVVASGTLFYAWAPVLATPPARDPLVPAGEVDHAQFSPTRIARSASTNGLAFAPGPDVLVASEAWEGSALSDPYPLVLEGGRVRLYYAADGGIGVAEAPAIDGTFTKIGTAPILGAIAGAGVPKSPSVVTDGAGFLLFVEAGGHVFAARSDDGLVFALVDGNDATVAIDPLSLPPQPQVVPDGGMDDAAVPAAEIGLANPCATRTTTAEGRDQLRLYFDALFDDGTSKVGVAASYGSLPLERAPYPAIAKNAPRASTPDVRRTITVLYAAASVSLPGGVVARSLVGYVSPAVAALPIPPGAP